MSLIHSLRRGILYPVVNTAGRLLAKAAGGESVEKMDAAIAKDHIYQTRRDAAEECEEAERKIRNAQQRIEGAEEGPYPNKEQRKFIDDIDNLKNQ